jgi:transposase
VNLSGFLIPRPPQGLTDRSASGGFIKGHKYTLLSRPQNLSLSGKQALTALLQVDKRFDTAYVLKESFGQPWDDEHEGWARKFFDDWRANLVDGAPPHQAFRTSQGTRSGRIRQDSLDSTARRK